VPTIGRLQELWIKEAKASQEDALGGSRKGVEARVW